jgi:uncharacterized protein (TIGR02594 family)
MAKFQNQTIDYKSLLKLTNEERLAMMQDQQGRSLLSSLTPEQLSSMFPDYYKRKLPDISGFLAAMTGEGRSAYAGSQGKTYSTETGDQSGRPTAQVARSVGKPSWMEKLEQETGVNVSDPGAKAQLSQIKMDTLKALESGALPPDDPRVAFLKELSPADLKKAGIEKKDDGSFVRKEVSEEEIKAKVSEQKVVTKVVSAGQGQPTVVEYADGKVESRTGDRNWRNNNPGNLEYGDFAKSKGAIGTDGRFAIFPSPEAGRAAKSQLLFEGKRYKDNTIEGAISAYAPPNENNTAAYISNVSKSLGLPPTTKMSSLNEDQRKVLLDAIQKQEGGVRPGKIETLKEGLGINGNPTPDQIEEAKKKIRADQEQHLANLTEVPKSLPAGVDPKVAEYYESLNPGQKQRFNQALSKMGDNTEAQVAKLNETFKKNPDSVAQPGTTVVAGPGMVGYKGGNIDIPKTQSDAHKVIAESATGTVKYQASVIDRAVELLGAHERKDKEQIKAYLKKAGKTADYFQGANDIDTNQGPWCAAFVNASLAQQGIKHSGSNLAGSYLDWGQQKKAEETSAGDVLAMKDKSHVGLSTGKTRIGPDGQMQIEMLGGNQGDKVTKMWVSADKVSVRRAGEDQYHPEVLAAIKRGEADQSTVAAVQQQTGVKVGDKGQQPEAQPGTVPAAGPGMVGSNQQAAQAPAPAQAPAQATNVQTANKTEAPPTAAAQPEQPAKAPAQQTAQAEPKPENVQALASGGEQPVETENITAYPIGGLRGDNSVVVDQDAKPLFTMNTKKETAEYNPRTGKVHVEPVFDHKEKLEEHKNELEEKIIQQQPEKKKNSIKVLAEGGDVSLQSDPVTKNDPESLAAPEPEAKSEPAEPEQKAPEQAPMSDKQPSPSPPNTSFDAMTQMSANPFVCPSFERAINAANFKKSGNHFDHGATNLR